MGGGRGLPFTLADLDSNLESMAAPLQAQCVVSVAGHCEASKGRRGTVEDGELVCSGLKISGVSACIIGVAYAARTPRQGHMNTAIDTTRRKGHYGGCKG